MNSKLTNLTDEDIDTYHKWKESFWGKIEGWWWDKIGNKIYDFKIGCKNLIKWAPIIWKDRDWDSYHTFNILKTKLYFTSQLIIKNQRHVGWERDVERIILCIKLIDYVQNDHYGTIAWDKLYEKYGESKFKFIPIENSTMMEMKVTYPNIESGQYTQEEFDIESRKLSDEAIDKHDRAHKLIFKILDKHIGDWWD